MRKTDRRTVYTKNIIKEVILELSKKKDFDKITVTEVCKIAEINRGTFYIHYIDLYDVLDDILNDIFESSSNIFEHLKIKDKKESSKCTYPLCKIVQENEKYKDLIFNDSLTSYIIDRIVLKGKDNFVSDIMELCHLPKELAEAIFIFQINGCFAINKSMNRNGNKKWCETQSIIDKFIEGGLKNIIDIF